MADIKTLRGRKWLITINNPVEDFENYKTIITKKWPTIRYFCYCKEVGNTTHTEHDHVFLWLTNPVFGSSVMKTFPNAHIDFCNGTAQDNRDYVYKEGKYKDSDKEDTKIEGMQYESGPIPKEFENQGQRNDLLLLRNLIFEGKTNAEIYEINANYMKYSNNIDKIRQDILSVKFGSEWRDIEVVYIEGSTGSGKTRGIMDGFGYTNVCRIKKDDYGFSNYTAQDVIIFEEFRNTFKLEDMLDYLDGYPVEGRALYGKRQLGYSKVFICSNWSLSEQYQNIQENHPKDWQAFLRRINKVIIRNKSNDQVFYQKNIGSEDYPVYDFFDKDGVSYFDPFGLSNQYEDFFTDDDSTCDDFFS